MLKRAFVNTCVWIAERHTACAALWNDVASAVMTGRSLAEIRKAEKQGESDGRDC